jgi:hypothetical protein
MENAAISNTNWKEIGVTTVIVLVAGFVASLAAIYVHEGIQKMAAKKSSSKESDAKKV